MARPSTLEALLFTIIDRIADRIASRLQPGRAAAPTKRRSSRAGRELDMSCRVEGCRNRSRGPRFGFMCEQHSRLPKKQQQAARDAWKVKNAA